MQTEEDNRPKFKVALVHDWMIHMRGGEKVLEGLAEVFPDAVIYTLFYDRAKLSPSLQRMKLRASFLQKIPGVRYFYRYLLPILPWIIKSMEVTGADLVISSSHCVAKAIRIPRKAAHICYCHTPMRYLWGFEKDYFGQMPPVLRPVIRKILNSLRRFDLETNEQVDHFIANSENVRGRIEKFYGRSAEVVYPPVDLTNFYPDQKRKVEEDYYLIVSAFVPYKRVDLVIEAFNELDRNLLIVGTGPLESKYHSLRRSSRISFLGPVPGDELRKLYSGARAVIFPTDEDFGIVPLEAQACGTPVIAFGAGGALESVKTGVFFKLQNSEHIRQAVKDFEACAFDLGSTPEKMKIFSKERFKREMKAVAERVMERHHAAR